MSIRRLSSTSITGTGGKSSKLWDQETTLGTLESIATVTFDGTSNSATFTNIPQNYSHLQIRGSVRTAYAAVYDTIYFYNYNNDINSTGSSFHGISGDGSTTLTTSGTASFSSVLGYVPGNSALSTVYGGFVIDILDYSSTAKLKTVRSLWGYDVNGTGGYVGLWSSSPITRPGTSSVVSLTFICNGNIQTGSAISLYGIRGA